MLLRPHLLYFNTCISYGFPPERDTEGVESIQFLLCAVFVDHGMPKSRWAGIALALLVIAAGLYPMIAALGMFPDLEAQMKAPRWVVFLAGSLFFLAGMWLLLQVVAGRAVAKVSGTVVGIAIFLGLAAIGNWVAFGGGDRGDCSGGISALGFGFSQAVSELECRAAFGYGALLMDLILLWGLAWWLANRAFPGSKPARALEKVSEWGIGLLLLPLILLALLLKGLQEGGARLFNRLRGRSDEKG